MPGCSGDVRTRAKQRRRPRCRTRSKASFHFCAEKRRDLSAIALDMDGLPSFDRRVYEVARTIAPGATLSYGEISARLGARDLAREVGQALGRNPFPIIVPCHRVLAAGGKAGGFSANGGITTKLRLLTIERARTSDTPTLFDGDSAFGFAMRPRRRNSR